jgi:hypothetical protein
LDAAQRMLPIPFRLIKEAPRDIVGHERHPMVMSPAAIILIRQ